jgi:hypothetical protein
MKLLDLVARERTRRADNPDGVAGLPDITDEDRVKALEAFLAKVRAGNLSAKDQQGAEKLVALVQRVTGVPVMTASPAT